MIVTTHHAPSAVIRGTGKRIAVLVAAAVGLLAALASTVLGLVVGPAGASTNTVYLDPHGSGTTCTRSAPCGTLIDGVRAAPPGGTVIANPGTYPGATGAGQLKLKTTKAVTIQSAASGTATFGQTLIKQPNLTFRNVAFTGLISIRQPGTLLDGIHVIGGSQTGEILVRADNTTIQNSLLEGGVAHDGIDIAGYPNAVHNVLVQDTTVRDIGGDFGPKQAHPDCVQIYDAHQVTLLRDNLYNCYNSALTFSPGAHKGDISDVTVQSSFLQGCISTRQRCGNGGSAMDLRVPVGPNVILNHNTFGIGSVRLPYHDTVTASHNIVGYVSVSNPCTTSFTDSLIGGYPKSTCKKNNGVTSSATGNQSGSPAFVDKQNGNLRLATAPAPTISSGSPKRARAQASGTLTDIDNNPLDADTLGAYQPQGGASHPSEVPSSPAPHRAPMISRTLTSAHAPTASGWYRSAVTVTYSCSGRGATLVTPCPALQRLTGSGHHTLAAYTADTAEGSAGVASRRVNIDTIAPRMHLVVQRNGSHVRARCVATDTLSGLSNCLVHRSIGHEVVRFIARVRDRAGNTTRQILRVPATRH